MSSELVRVRHSELPSFLQSSAFSRSLYQDTDSESDHDGFRSRRNSDSSGSSSADLPRRVAKDNVFEVPRAYMKMNLAVSRPSELNHLLSTLRYWGVDEIPTEVIEFCLSHSLDTLRETIEEYKAQYPCLSIVLELREVDRNSWMNHAARRGSVVVLRYLHHDLELNWNETTCATIAGEGHLDCLKFARSHGCNWDKSTCERAARGGHLSCLIFAHTNGCDWDDVTCAESARYGHLPCLQYAHENGCAWGSSTAGNAALGDHMNCLKYAREQGCSWDVATCTNAAKAGSLECLAYAHDNGCPWNDNTSASAAMAGQLVCFSYLHEHGCLWNAFTTAYAARSGHLHCLIYAHQNGCPWDEKTCSQVFRVLLIALFLRYILSD